MKIPKRCWMCACNFRRRKNWSVQKNQEDVESNKMFSMNSIRFCLCHHQELFVVVGFWSNIVWAAMFAQTCCLVLRCSKNQILNFLTEYISHEFCSGTKNNRKFYLIFRGLMWKVFHKSNDHGKDQKICQWEFLQILRLAFSDALFH